MIALNVLCYVWRCFLLCVCFFFFFCSASSFHMCVTPLTVNNNSSPSGALVARSNIGQFVLFAHHVFHLEEKGQVMYDVFRCVQSWACPKICFFQNHSRSSRTEETDNGHVGNCSLWGNNSHGCWHLKLRAQSHLLLPLEVSVCWLEQQRRRTEEPVECNNYSFTTQLAE